MNDALIQHVSEAHGTPFYLYDIDGIRQQIGRLKEALGPRFEVALSVKANPNPNLLRRVHASCALVDVASQGEMLLARMAGVAARRMIFVGPGKRLEEIDFAIESGVGCIVAESIEEARDISMRSARLGKTAAMALRVNPDHHNGAGMAMGGTPSQFGVDEAVAIAHIAELARLPATSFLGIQVYLGTQVLDADHLCEGIAYILDLALRLQERAGVPFEMVDIGGGFGIPYFDGERPLDLARLSSRLRLLLESDGIRHRLGARTRLIAETGRFVFADNGVYCARVLYRKRSRDRHYAILDGGSNFNGNLSGLGKLLRKNFPFRVLRNRTDAQADDTSRYTLVGPLCTPMDQLAVNAPGAVPNPGDLVVFEKSGAYGLTFSQTGFLSHLAIQEWGVEGGRLLPLKKRKTAELLHAEFDVE